jgi:hypothetical protein
MEVNNLKLVREITPKTPYMTYLWIDKTDGWMQRLFKIRDNLYKYPNSDMIPTSNSVAYALCFASQEDLVEFKLTYLF